MGIHKGENVVDFATRATGVVSPPVSPPGVTPTLKSRHGSTSSLIPTSLQRWHVLPAVQESFSRVFSGWSVTDDAAASPRPGDYVSVALILSGLSLAAVTSFYLFLAAIPYVGAGGVMKGTVGISTELTASGTLATLTSFASKIVGNPFFKLVTAAAFIFMAFWNLTDPIWWQSAFIKSSGDFKARFEKLRIDVSTYLKQAYNLVHISPTAATRAEARRLLSVTKPLINQLFNMLSGPEIDKEIRQKYPEFEDQVKAFVSQFNDLVTLAGGSGDELLKIEGMLIDVPVIIPKYPEEITVPNVDVYDGDTIYFPGHEDVKGAIRFAGMDAHEAGTDAGKAETAYLKSLIQGKTITLKIDPVNVSELYGRLLGVPFLDGVNVVHLMLAKFGKEIIGTKYKNKYVDYDQELRIAKGEEAVGGGGVPTPPAAFKLYIDSVPTNSKLYIDGIAAKHNTPSDEKELKDVMSLLTPGQHTFKATRAGMEGSVTVTLTAGDNGRISIPLATIGLPSTTTPATGTLESRVASLEKMLASIAAKLGV